MKDLITAEWTDAVEAIERCYDLGWTDGLPVVPPTLDRVRQFIDFAERDADEIIGEIPERRREVSVAKVAANAVMAGCLPEYFPVALAATEAMLAPEFNLIAPSSSQGGAAALAIVNGPITQELGMNSGANLFGPGNRPNATIGRAIRLVLMNACASIPGLFDRTVIGHPGKYTYCIAENESDSDWLPLHVERGFSAEQSAVTMFACWEPRQVRSASHSQEVVLDTVADVASVLGSSLASSDSVGDDATPVRQGQLAVTVAGAADFWGDWSKADVREYLHPRIGRSIADLKIVRVLEGDVFPQDYQTFAQFVPEPEDILVIRAGSPEAVGYRCAVILSELPKVASAAVTRVI